MMILPFQMSPSTFALYVILGRDNVERIEQYDPAIVQLKNLPAPWLDMQCVEVVITFATEAESQEIIRLASADRPKEALRLVTRGFRFRPDLGDYDGPPLSVKPGGTKQ